MKTKLNDELYSQLSVLAVFHFSLYDLRLVARLIGLLGSSTCVPLAHAIVLSATYEARLWLVIHSHANTRKMHMDESSPLFPRNSSRQHINVARQMHAWKIPYILIHQERPEYIYSEQVSQLDLH